MFQPSLLFVHHATSRDLFSVSTVSTVYRPPETQMISNLYTKIVKSELTEPKS